MSNTGLKRKTSDAFYTKPEVAKKCVEALSNVIKFEKYDTIVEPSAGSGLFSDIFLEIKDVDTLSYDINPNQD